MTTGNNSDDRLIGQVIAGRYRIISRLGFGGMGVAYRAWDGQAGVPVVIKMPHKRFLEDPTFAERSMREARVMEGFGHPHIVPVIDVGEHERLPFLVMRFLPGGSLSNRRLRDEKGNVKPNPPGMLNLWLPAVAEALDFVHASGVVHRDVKPANIFFDALWGAFLGDFGIAKVILESEVFEKGLTLTGTNMGVGTPEYMAPEQFAPKAFIDGRADQYALAVIAYEMVAGARPFTGEKENLIVEVMTRPAPPLTERVRGVPASLADAVHRGLAKKPDERFPTCSEFAAAVLRDVQPIDDEPDMARLLCPKCANLLKLPTSAAGKKGKCPKCQTEMKVAADLGAMWLLDEARRQEDAASVGGFELAGSAAGGDEPSLDTFRSVSGTTPAMPAAGRGPRRVLAWIDGHGLILGGVLAIAALISWVLPAGKPDVPQPVGNEGRLPADPQAPQAELTAANERVNSLKQDLERSQGAVASLKAELESLKKRQPSDASTEDGLPEVKNGIGMVLKPVLPGTFQMGTNHPASNGGPAHEVHITNSYYLSAFEVTNAQWRRLMGEPPSRWQDDDHPVEKVSWNDAMAFCRKLSELPEEKAAGRVYRLPTEAEWEYACRAGTATLWSFGEDQKDLEAHAWFQENSGQQTHPVGTRKENPWGFSDMHGNVNEWCSDFCAPYSETAERDPQGPPGGDIRRLRGGGWRSGAGFCGSTFRNGVGPGIRSDDLGFRPVMTLSGSVAVRRPAEATPSPAAEPDERSISVGTPEEILALPPLTNSIGIELKLLPVGTFQMGSNDGDSDEKPVHEVRITKPFYLGVYEVTNAQWKAVMGDVPSHWKDDDRPVEWVSWEDAVRFCEKLSALPDEKAAGRVYRLPTEAEWEYACRAGTKTKFSCGDDETVLGDFAWFGKNGGGQTHPVGKKRPNPWALHDMHGNVWEWCSDECGAYGNGGVAGPQGPSGDGRAIRGGDGLYPAWQCRSAKRGGHEPSYRNISLGFRLALNPPEASSH